MVIYLNRHARWLYVIFLFIWLVGTTFVPAGPIQTVQAAPLADGFSCSSVTEIPSAECAALVALYNSTDGANWDNNTNWLATITPSNWVGVTVTAGNVTGLSLYNNQLSGSIASELGNLSKLQSLNISYNQLSGGIPPELGDLNELQYLSFSVNQLSSSIPSELGNLGKLRELYLDSNQLSGSIPPELGDLIELQYLYLSGNQLSGSIPPELGGLKGLQYLYLDGNQLTGSIPSELGDLSELQYLELSDNQLSSSFPSELVGLSKLQYLYLSDNQLSGNILPELSNLSELQYLNLSKNQFSGSIPSELGSLGNIRILRLSHNKLRGDVPTTFTQLTSIWEYNQEQDVAYLELDYNYLNTPASIPELAAYLALKDPDWVSTQIPWLTGFIPASITVGSSEFPLTVNGKNFITGSILRWNGADLVTTYVSATKLTAVVPKANVNRSGTTNITVFNPAPGGGASEILVFPITISGESGAGVLVSPDSSNSLTFTDPDDSTIQTTVTVPSGAVSSITQLIYIEKAAGPGNFPEGFLFGGRHFTLSVYINGEEQAGFTFTQPVRITFSYPANIPASLANTLELRYWNAASGQWSTDGITVVSRDTVHHQVVVDITHLSEFTLLFKGYQNFLPLFLN